MQLAFAPAAATDVGRAGPVSTAYPSLEALAAAGSAAEGVGTSGGGEVRPLNPNDPHVTPMEQHVAKAGDPRRLFVVYSRPHEIRQSPCTLLQCCCHPVRSMALKNNLQFTGVLRI